MIIANPIYDVAFKRLLENNRVAKFLVGTILDCKVISLEHIVYDRTKFDEVTGQLTLYRMDFAATIETQNEGSKRVIIEMQKAKSLSDVYRFREYLGGEYTTSKLPIIAIYILGFNLSVDTPAFAAYPEYEDLRTREKLVVHDDFVEHLTHKAYFVQAKRIKPSLNTKLDMLLTVFGQENFISSDKTVKDFPANPADVECPEIKEVLDILHYVAVDAKARKELDEEIYYQNYVESMFGEKDRKIEEYKTQNEEYKVQNEEYKAQLSEMKQKMRLLAKQLKGTGLPPQKIAEATGVPVDEINNI